MDKRFFSGLLVLAMVISLTSPAFASQQATPSDADILDEYFGGSDVEPFDPVLDPDNGFVGESVLRSSISAVKNTISYSGSYLTMAYYDMQSNIKNVSYKLDSSGYASIPRPSDCARIYYFSVMLTSSSLPRPGTYSFTCDFTSNTGFSYKSCQIYSTKKNLNASEQAASYYSPTFVYSSGDWQASCTIDIGSNLNSLSYVVFAADSNNAPSYLPYGGYVRVNFTKTSDPPDTTTAGGVSTPEDVQQNISNSSTQIADNTSEMAETLKEIVQTISNQLAALWDQMFNLIHLPDLANRNQNTDRIVDALGDKINVVVENNLEIAQEIKDNADKNASDIMNNDNKNTDTMVNGFDNSGLNSSNATLDSSLTEYDNVEGAILDSVSGYITDFTMPSYSLLPPGILTACLFFGNWLQRLFEGIGFFNFPITLSLTMIFVLMLIGYHRFRSG